jgi:hypothetical protein
MSLPQGWSIVDCANEYEALLICKQVFFIDGVAVKRSDKVQLIYKRAHYRAPGLPRVIRPPQIMPRVRRLACSVEDLTSKHVKILESDEDDDNLPESRSHGNISAPQRHSNTFQVYLRKLLLLLGLLYTRWHVFRKCLKLKYDAALRSSKAARNVVDRLFQPAPENGYGRLEWQCVCVMFDLLLSIILD